MTEAQIQNIPAELRAMPQWHVYKLVPRTDKKGKPTGKLGKPPVDPITGKCLDDWQSKCVPFDQAVSALRANKPRCLAGIGIVLKGTEPFSAVDIDHCLTDGKLTETAAAVVARLDAYTEVSPSGTGLRIIGVGKLPDGDSGGKHGNYEAYSGTTTAAHFLTVTGNVYQGKAKIRDFAADLAWYRKTHASKPTPPSCDQKAPAPKNVTASETSARSGQGGDVLTDADLIEKIKRSKNGTAFTALWSGDITGYQSQSEADCALCCHLAFWSGKDAARIDRLFRMSGLMRDKWNSDKYSQKTIEAALEQVDKVYRPDYYATPTASSSAPAPKSSPKLQTISAADLCRKEFAPQKFVIDQILPVGLTLLAGRPKKGKSWLALGLAMSVASGHDALAHYQVDGGDVLYMALEDSERRLQSRISKLCAPGESLPDRLHFMTTLPALAPGEALTAKLKEWRADHPDAKLIIIDTLKKIKPTSKRNANVYDEDYDFLGAYQRLALDLDIALILVHHTRKASDDDVFTQISGSTGLTGAADTMWVVEASGIGSGTRKLHVTGRDIEEQSLAMSFDDGLWCYAGDADTVVLSQERREIHDLLAKRGSLYPKQIADALKKPQSSICKLLRDMARDEQVFQDGQRGEYYVVVKVSKDGNDSKDGKDGKDGKDDKRDAILTDLTERGKDTVRKQTRAGGSLQPDLTVLTVLTQLEQNDAEEDVGGEL